jgi:hypothetical protein
MAFSNEDVERLIADSGVSGAAAKKLRAASARMNNPTAATPLARSVGHGPETQDLTLPSAF